MQGLAPGAVLDGRYRLDRLLAEGGMGSVWVGRQIALEREVAIKLLRGAVVGPLRERLRREALALAAVHHPAVVQVFDYGETPAGEPYLVMELVRGESLGARLGREGSIPARAAVTLALPLLEGLAAAHQAGVVHRDIKPENVVLADGPSGALPKLLDFGIARVERGAAAKLTVEGGFIGTPAYVAPEQARGELADERSDVWGIAVVLYEMIAGRPPFGHEDILAVLRRVVDEPPSYPREAKGLDGRLWGILMAAMRKDAAERTASALAFRDALAGWLDGAGAGAGAVSAAFGPGSGAPSRAPNPPMSPEARLASTLVAEAPPGPAVERGALDALIRAKLGRG